MGVRIMWVGKVKVSGKTSFDVDVMEERGVFKESDMT